MRLLQPTNPIYTTPIIIPHSRKINTLTLKSTKHTTHHLTLSPYPQKTRDYIEPRVPYVPMRLMPATLGILVVPIAYLTLRQSHVSSTASVLVSILLILENGLITQSRHILLDSPLLACTALTVFAWSCFHSEQRRPFRFWWWRWLALD